VSRPHLPTLCGGLAVTALGVLLLLDAEGAVDLRFGWAAPAVLAAVGLVLLTWGLSAREGGG
jgi:hypothetical protein